MIAEGETELSGLEAKLQSYEVSSYLTAEGEVHDRVKAVARAGMRAGWAEIEQMKC